MTGNKKEILVVPSVLFLSEDRLSSAHKDIAVPERRLPCLSEREM